MWTTECTWMPECQQGKKYSPSVTYSSLELILMIGTSCLTSITQYPYSTERVPVDIWIRIGYVYLHELPVIFLKRHYLLRSTGLWGATYSCSTYMSPGSLPPPLRNILWEHLKYVLTQCEGHLNIFTHNCIHMFTREHCHHYMTTELPVRALSAQRMYFGHLNRKYLLLQYLAHLNTHVTKGIATAT